MAVLCRARGGEAGTPQCQQEPWDVQGAGVGALGRQPVCRREQRAAGVRGRHRGPGRVTCPVWSAGSPGRPSRGRQEGALTANRTLPEDT